MKNIIALILAGGDSSRLWPLGDKHFVKFIDKPLIHYSISALVKFGFSEIVIVVNDNNRSLFEQYLSIYKYKNIHLVNQTDPRGMAGAVISAEKIISGKPILVVGPSDIHENILFDDLKELLKSNPDGILAGIYHNSYFPGGYLIVKDKAVTGIVEKPSPSEVPSNIVNFVFDYIKNSDLLLASIKQIKTKHDDLYERALESLIRQEKIFKFLPYKGYWGYLKFPWHILGLNSYFLSKIRRKYNKVLIHKTAVIEGEVMLEDGVRILENVKIIGPAYIGKGTVIGQNSLIRESMIGSNCVIGFTTEIARSHIGDNCWFHNNYIGDSVISNNVSMGAGAVLANFKLNEATVNSFIKLDKVNTERSKLGAIVGRNVRVGVNASIMPGVKIGQGSYVGAGVVLDSDLPDNKFCFIKSKSYEINNNNFTVSSELRKKIGQKLFI